MADLYNDGAKPRAFPTGNPAAGAHFAREAFVEPPSPRRPHPPTSPAALCAAALSLTGGEFWTCSGCICARLGRGRGCEMEGCGQPLNPFPLAPSPDKQERGKTPLHSSRRSESNEHRSRSSGGVGPGTGPGVGAVARGHASGGGKVGLSHPQELPRLKRRRKSLSKRQKSLK